MQNRDNDVLSDVLRAVRLEGTAYFQADFAAPWGMSFGRSDFSNFHLVSRGSCWFVSDDRADPVQLAAGDLVVFPHGDSHRLASDTDTKTLPAQQLISETERRSGDRLLYGGNGERATLICGHFDYDKSGAHPLWSALPASIVLRRKLEDGSGSIFATATEMTVTASASSDPASRAVVDRLAEILLIQIIREYARAADLDGGFFAALADEAIGRVLRSVHTDPGRAWSVAMLSDVAGMSRSALANGFQRLLGTSPMQYVTLWRMHRAKELLVTGRLPLAEVAEQVGYESEWSFAKAFKRVFGEGPGAARRHQRAAGE